jgi:hypothetical protein
MTAHNMEKALQELELLAGQIERLEFDLTCSPVTGARPFAFTLHCSQRSWATAERRAEVVANTRKVCGLFAYLTACVSQPGAITA